MFFLSLKCVEFYVILNIFEDQLDPTEAFSSSAITSLKEVLLN